VKAYDFNACPKTVDKTQIVGIAAGICTSVSLLPQLIKLIKTKKAEDLSLFYLGILFIGIALWIWYGTMREDVPIIATNSFSLLINAIVIILGWRYKRQNSEANSRPG
jgi:MtN3 and saliva related transmembrane protein